MEMDHIITYTMIYLVLLYLQDWQKYYRLKSVSFLLRHPAVSHCVRSIKGVLDILTNHCVRSIKGVLDILTNHCVRSIKGVLDILTNAIALFISWSYTHTKSMSVSLLETIN